MQQRRRAMSEAARAEGLGRVVRVHRQLGLGWVGMALLVLLAIAVVPAVIWALSEQSLDAPLWQWPLFAWSAAVLLLLLLLVFGPVPGGRRWIAMTERGLLIWSRERATSLTWSTATIERLPRGTFTGQMALEAAIRRGRPQAVVSPMRVIGWAVIGAVVFVAVFWTGVPVAQHVLLGERLVDAAQFARLCQSGEPFPRAAAFDGIRPYPVVAIDADDSTVSYVNGWDWEDSPEEVQLVACLRRAGTATESAIDTCSYVPVGPGSGAVETWYQGRYRVDVIEARTGRQAASFQIDGPSRHSCSPDKLVGRDSGGAVTSYTAPTDAALRAAFDRAVG